MREKVLASLSAGRPFGRWISRFQTPARSLIILCTALFIAEFTVMALLSFLPEVSAWVHYALDSALLLLLAIPALYFFVQQPLHREIAARRRVESELRDHRKMLEQTVERRTADLQQSNSQLQSTITQRRATERALAESQQDLSRAQAVSHTGNWRLDLQRNELVWSDETYRIFEVPAGTRLTYELFLNHVHPEDRAYVDAEWKAAVGGKVYSIDHRIMAGGVVKWVREKAELEFDSLGNLRGGFGTVQDLSELKKTEAALAESERRHRELVELSPDAIIVQREQRCVFANSAGAALIKLGIPLETCATDCDICRCIREEDRAAACAWLHRIEHGDNDTAPAHECELSIPGRAPMHVEIRGQRVRFEGTAAIQVIIRDITERKKVREERRRLLAQLANDRAMLDVTMENTRAQLAYLDAEFRYRHVNSAFERGCGYLRDQLIGRSHFALFPSAENEAIFRRVRDTGEPVEFFAQPFEHSCRPERKVGYWDWTLVCMRNPGGQVEGLVLSLMDVTAAKRAEQALRESEERMREALKVGRMFTFEWDPATDIVVRSPHCAEILGLHANATKDTGQDFLLRVHPDDRDRFSSSVLELTPAADRYVITYRVVRPDGSLVILDEAGRGLFDAQGKLLRVHGLTADVTQREQAQRAELNRMARATTVNHLAASIAHELRQPLTAIMSNAEAAGNFLRQRPPDLSEVDAVLKDISADTDRASAVIQRLRALHGKTGIDRIALDLNALIQETIELLRSELIFRQSSWRLDLDLQLPRPNADRIECQQVIMNLVLNAAESMAAVAADERCLTIGTAREDSTFVRVTVQDTGVGLGPEAATRLFEPFFTTKKSGMGMGLNVCRSIVQAHGGRIWARNNAQRGAAFSFTLPIPATAPTAS